MIKDYCILNLEYKIGGVVFYLFKRENRRKEEKEVKK